MDRGFEQLILLALFLLAALVDWLVRWLKGRTRAPTSTEEVLMEDEAEPLAEREWLDSEAPAAPPVVPAPVRAPAMEELVVRRPVQPAHPPKIVRRHGKARVRRMLHDEARLRHAIVVMEVLGPCRGLDHRSSRL